MKEYITGSNGFLGSRLAKELADPKAIPHELIKSTTLEPFTRFFFLSTYGNMASHDDDAKKIIQANIYDLCDMAVQAVQFDFKSFIFVSTSSVKLKYQTMYSRTKKAAEEVLLALMEKTNKPFCVIRPYSITGVGEQPQHLIPTLIRSCLEGEKMSFVPGPVHDFMDVDDVVQAILNLSEARTRGIFEVGTGVGYTNQDVLELVEKVTSKKANIVSVGKMRAYDNESWVCRNYRARSFGWLPRKTLEQSIEEMVGAYEKI